MHTNARRYLEEKNIIKPNPMLSSLRYMRFLWGFYIACGLGLLVLPALIQVIFEGGLHGSQLLFSPFIMIAAQGIVSFALTALQLRYWEAIERRRFAAVQSKQEWPTGQAAQSDVTMKLPVVIKLRFSKGFYLRMAGLSVLISLMIAGAFTFDNNFMVFTTNRLTFFLGLFVSITFVFCILLFVIFATRGRQRIEVTERGITTYPGSAGKADPVPWEEARLFARYVTFGARKSGAAITYELSSAHAIARWTEVQGKANFVGLEPTIPFAEYRRQMQALRELIIAMTRLPLDDLSRDN